MDDEKYSALQLREAGFVIKRLGLWEKIKNNLQGPVRGVGKLLEDLKDALPTNEELERVFENEKSKKIFLAKYNWNYLLKIIGDITLENYKNGRGDTFNLASVENKLFNEISPTKSYGLHLERAKSLEERSKIIAINAVKTRFLSNLNLYAWIKSERLGNVNLFEDVGGAYKLLIFSIEGPATEKRQERSLSFFSPEKYGDVLRDLIRYRKERIHELQGKKVEEKLDEVREISERILKDKLIVSEPKKVVVCKNLDDLRKCFILVDGFIKEGHSITDRKEANILSQKFSKYDSKVVLTGRAACGKSFFAYLVGKHFIEIGERNKAIYVARDITTLDEVLIADENTLVIYDIPIEYELNTKIVDVVLSSGKKVLITCRTHDLKHEKREKDLLDFLSSAGFPTKLKNEYLTNGELLDKVWCELKEMGEIETLLGEYQSTTKIDVGTIKDEIKYLIKARDGTDILGIAKAIFSGLRAKYGKSAKISYKQLVEVLGDRDVHDQTLEHILERTIDDDAKNVLRAMRFLGGYVNELLISPIHAVTLGCSYRAYTGEMMEDNTIEKLLSSGILYETNDRIKSYLVYHPLLLNIIKSRLSDTEQRMIFLELIKIIEEYSEVAEREEKAALLYDLGRLLFCDVLKRNTGKTVEEYLDMDKNKIRSAVGYIKNSMGLMYMSDKKQAMKWAAFLLPKLLKDITFENVEKTRRSLEAVYDLLQTTGYSQESENTIEEKFILSFFAGAMIRTASYSTTYEEFVSKFEYINNIALKGPINTPRRRAMFVSIVIEKIVTWNFLGDKRVTAIYAVLDSLLDFVSRSEFEDILSVCLIHPIVVKSSSAPLILEAIIPTIKGYDKISAEKKKDLILTIEAFLPEEFKYILHDFDIYDMDSQI